MANPNIVFRFKNEVPDQEDRRKQAVMAFNQHPDKVPVILDRVSSSELKELPRCKYLLPAVAPVSHIVQLLQEWHKLPNTFRIRIYADGIIIDKSQTLASVYMEYRETDYFLYLGYIEERQDV